MMQIYLSLEICVVWKLMVYFNSKQNASSMESNGIFIAHSSVRIYQFKLFMKTSSL